MKLPPTPVPPKSSKQTIAAYLRELLPDQTWSQVRTLVTSRRVRIDEVVCADPARRVKTGEMVELMGAPIVPPRNATAEGLTIRHLDDHIVVVEKASGINTVRHPAEREWTDERRKLAPTLQDITQLAIARMLTRKPHTLPRLRIVQRLDQGTSGLVVFSRSVEAERSLGHQFADHSVIRRYTTIVPGLMQSRTIHSWLMRDRGDGRRGSAGRGNALLDKGPSDAKEATTHVQLAERLPRHSVMTCKLETGRTHQIRIHLSEAGYSVCGEKVYIDRERGAPIPPDPDECPRLALHAFELGFIHPGTMLPVLWEMPLPPDLLGFLNRIRIPPKKAT